MVAKQPSLLEWSLIYETQYKKETKKNTYLDTEFVMKSTRPKICPFYYQGICTIKYMYSKTTHRGQLCPNQCSNNDTLNTSGDA